MGVDVGSYGDHEVKAPQQPVIPNSDIIAVPQDLSEEDLDDKLQQLGDAIDDNEIDSDIQNLEDLEDDIQSNEEDYFTEEIEVINDLSKKDDEHAGR